jgi:hypothetical protein
VCQYDILDAKESKLPPDFSLSNIFFVNTTNIYYYVPEQYDRPLESVVTHTHLTIILTITTELF